MVIPVFAETFKINKFLPIYFLTFFAFFSKFIFLGSAGRAEPLMIQAPAAIHIRRLAETMCVAKRGQQAKRMDVLTFKRRLQDEDKTS